jgi:hypothetical protein
MLLLRTLQHSQTLETWQPGNVEADQSEAFQWLLNVTFSKEFIISGIVVRHLIRLEINFNVGNFARGIL